MKLRTKGRIYFGGVVVSLGLVIIFGSDLLVKSSVSRGTLFFVGYLTGLVVLAIFNITGNWVAKIEAAADAEKGESDA